MSALPPGPVASKLSCPKCKATLRTATKPKGTGPKFLPVMSVALGLSALAVALFYCRPARSREARRARFDGAS